MIQTANLVGSVSRNAGGLFESVRRLVQCLAETPMDVRVLATEDEFTKEDIAAWGPIDVRTFRSSWPHNFGYARGLYEELESFSPDVTHTHGLWQYASVVVNRYC